MGVRVQSTVRDKDAYRPQDRVLSPVDEEGDGVDVDGAAEEDQEEGPEDEEGLEVLFLPREDGEAELQEDGRLGDHGQEREEEGGAGLCVGVRGRRCLWVGKVNVCMAWRSKTFTPTAS